ncbi:MAG: macro domain-containing protein, partial [Lachnospiraceae bacterium]|nr:macro domain-containing protein [Lachnospiraceae bacterium]
MGKVNLTKQIKSQNRGNYHEEELNRNRIYSGQKWFNEWLGEGYYWRIHQRKLYLLLLLTERKIPAKYIIHVVSPFYKDGESGEEDLLRSCYRKSLELAYENKCESIAFPLISTGSFGY